MKLQCSLRSFLTFEITPSDHLSPKATGDRIRARLGLITKDSDTFVTGAAYARAIHTRGVEHH
jgi:hypothetical protein